MSKRPTISFGDFETPEKGVAIVLVAKGGAFAEEAGQAVGGGDRIARIAQISGFTGALGKTAEAIGTAAHGVEKIVLVGVGDPGRLGNDDWVKIGGAAFSRIGRSERATVTLALPEATVAGDEAADFVWNMRWRGHDIIRKRVARYGIDCDLRHGHMQTAYRPSHVAELEQMHRAACEHGMGDEVGMVYGAGLRDHVGTGIYHAGLVNRRNMHLHPLNLCLGEADAARSLGARVFIDSPVEKIVYGNRPELVTARGRVRADKVMIAGNGYHRLAPRRLAGLLFPATLGIVATERLPEDVAKSILPNDFAVYDTRFVLDYYRLTADRRLLFGSGTNYKGTQSTDIGAPMLPAIRKTFPQLAEVKIDFAWEGQDGITINRIPQLGNVTPNVFYAQGYSGHGIATSHIVAEIMAAAITGDSRDFELFAGARHWRLPVGRYLGNRALAVGMWYFQKLEALR